MIIAGLTGSVGMGKSTVAAMFARAKVPVFSADEAVHDLYQGKASAKIENHFPGTVKQGIVDRRLLSEALMQDHTKFQELEALIHPMVQQAEWDFIKTSKIANDSAVIIEIPLLFETGADQLMDVVIVVSARAAIQKKRVLARDRMCEDKFQVILAQQMPDDEKKRNADFILDTSCTIAETEQAVGRLMKRLEERYERREPTAYNRWQNLYEKI